MHNFKVNGFDSAKWNLSFEDGTYQELVKAPTKKTSPLDFDWADQHGKEVDRSYNFYESKEMSLPVFIDGVSEEEMLLKYNQFVNEVLISGMDIILSVEFLNRVFTLRYVSASNTRWYPEMVNFNIELVDDFPHLITPIV